MGESSPVRRAVRACVGSASEGAVPGDRETVRRVFADAVDGVARMPGPPLNVVTVPGTTLRPFGG